jgi:hypothetical protein
MVAAERDAWILVAARWPDRTREIMPAKLAQLDDPQLVRLYRVGSEILESYAGDGPRLEQDDSRLEEVADIMAGLLEQAHARGEINRCEGARDDLPFELLDAQFAESHPQAERMLDLMRERGWAGWIRPERLAEPPGPVRSEREEQQRDRDRYEDGGRGADQGLGGQRQTGRRGQQPGDPGDHLGVGGGQGA